MNIYWIILGIFVLALLAVMILYVDARKESRVFDGVEPEGEAPDRRVRNEHAVMNEQPVDDKPDITPRGQGRW